MNEVSFRKALRQLGSNGRKELQQITAQIGCVHPSLEVRIAPSLITRSEAELFSISVPRFALRFYLPENAGFINCRRLADFCGYSGLHLPSAWGKRYSSTTRKRYPEDIDPDPPRAPLEDFLESAKQSCIADCLLAPPKWLTGEGDPPQWIWNGFFQRKHEFHLLSADLWKDYGETSVYKGVMPTGLSPYLKHISLGGGQCGQSVCFIATAILNKAASGVYGLAEISALAHGTECVEFPISGLNLDDINNYVRAVSLGCYQQFPTPSLVDSESTLENNHSSSLTLAFQRELGTALNAYLLSGMPVIFPTDLSILAGKQGGATTGADVEASVYACNGWKIVKDLDPIASHRHTIILVGCSVESGNVDPDCENIYIFHDPTAGPFMISNLRQLSTIGNYKNKEKTEREDGLFMPVTPKEVRVPLLCWRKNERQPTLAFGLIAKAVAHRRYSTNLPTIEPNGFGDFFLCQMSEIGNKRSTRSVVKIGDRIALRKILIESAKSIEDTLIRGAEHWVWVECGPDTVWIWDAEIEFITTTTIDTDKMLICYFESKGGVCTKN